jgi:Zn finger protein HypA/HybF involved in hydrogenase expression
MGFSTDWRCEQCGYTLCISGLWEFYRDDMGLRRFYGHPGASSPEAAESGVKGFTTDDYCPKCREIRTVVVLEFVNPKNRALDAWLSVKQNQYQTLCDRCGTPLKNSLEESDVCPKCNKGHFKICSRYMS